MEDAAKCTPTVMLRKEVARCSSAAKLRKDPCHPCPGRSLRTRRGNRAARRPRTQQLRAAPAAAALPAEQWEEPAPEPSPELQADAAAAAARAFLRRLGSATVLAAEGTPAAATATEAPCALSALLAADGNPSLSAHRRRRVSFDLGADTVHEVQAYSEIYGLHPREFVFDRDSSLSPSGDRFGFVGMPTLDADEDSESESESELEWEVTWVAHKEEEEEAEDAGLVVRL